jgi:hypothetical protein
MWGRRQAQQSRGALASPQGPPARTRKAPTFFGGMSEDGAGSRARESSAAFGAAVTFPPHDMLGLIRKETAARAATGRLISATAGSRPVPSLNFGEVREAALSSLTSHQAVRYAAQLLNILIDKILATTETKY